LLFILLSIFSTPFDLAANRFDIIKGWDSEKLKNNFAEKLKNDCAVYDMGTGKSKNISWTLIFLTAKCFYSMNAPVKM